MEKSRIYHIVEWGVALTAGVYLIWRLVTYDDYLTLGNTLCSMGVAQWLALALCIALMPLNMALEAWRWKTLLPMPWSNAHRQVYYSKLAGLVTPWRLGEYPARGVLLAEMQDSNKALWPRILSMGAVGSATMTAAIVVAGLLSLCLLGITDHLGTIDHDRLAMQAYIFIVCAVSVVMAVALALAPRLLRRWAAVSRRLIALSFWQSLVRLFCWCIQLGLVLYALGAYQSFVTALQLPVYYLFVTITPNVPIVEAGVRGVWAIAVFGSLNAGLAGVLLWAVNTLLPCLVWLFIRK